MRKKMIWGLVTLIILLLGVSVFLLLRNIETDPENVYKPPTPEEEAQVNVQIQDAIDKSKIPTARPGFKIIKHDDHYHEVPITEAENTMPVDKPVAPGPKQKSGGLTYHAELLETNPVKALRLQAEERGHFSAQWIPPFPPDDQEAAAYARSQYLILYYGSLEDSEIPEGAFKTAWQENITAYRAIKSYPHGARKLDLMKLTWVNLDEQPYEMYNANGFRFGPSDYFPKWRSEAEKRATYKRSGFYDLFMEIEKLQEQGLLPE